AIAGHDPPKVHVHGYPKLVAVAREYRLQVRSFSSKPGAEVRRLHSLAVLGRSRELIKLRSKRWSSSATLRCHQPSFIVGRMYLRKAQKEVLLSSLKRSSGTGENRVLICVNTQDLRESLVIS